MIADGRVVEIEYTLHLGDGEVIDRSPEGEPLSYVRPGRDRARAGARPGRHGAWAVEGGGAATGGGLRRLRSLGRPRAAARHVRGRRDPRARQAVRGPRPKRRGAAVLDQEVGEETVLADFNHPLASRTLHFDVTVRSVREATPQELEEAGLSGPPTSPPVDPLARCQRAWQRLRPQPPASVHPAQRRTRRAGRTSPLSNASGRTSSARASASSVSTRPEVPVEVAGRLNPYIDRGGVAASEARRDAARPPPPAPHRRPR